MLSKRGLGGIGWVAAVIGGAMTLFEAGTKESEKKTGSARKRRKGRSAAQNFLLVQQREAGKFRASSEQHKGKQLSDHLYKVLLAEALHILNKTQEGSIDYFAGGTYWT